ncbi:DUF423 domain-containing protein [Azospirillum sp. A39]|uniref:DUF423 domain-containing protein n=1 Tax=Azospirillum sp. A39 TaxID=3462279 RepID=UPI0040454302
MGGIGRIWLALAGLNGALAVAAGAYASHGLAAPDLARAQDLVRLASQFQLWHAPALVGAALLAARCRGGARLAVRAFGWLTVAGTTLFCGTLYLQAAFGPLPVPMTAPLGGSALILGWLSAALAAILPGWRWMADDRHL